MGAAIYKTKGDTLCWELGSTEVVDHRQSTSVDDILYTKCRLPIGKLLLPMNGQKSNLTIDLYNADVKGDIGNLKWNSLIPHQHNVLIIELSGDEKLPEVSFQPEVSQSPRAIYNVYNKNKPEDYQPNPKPEIIKKGIYNIIK